MEPVPNSFLTRLFLFTVKHRVSIIVFLDFISLVIAGYILLGTFFAGGLSVFNYRLGIWCGRVGIVVYVCTIIPGILRRFKIHHPLGQTLMLFRRQTGVMAFLLVLLHGWFNKGFGIVFAGRPLLPLALYSIFGISAGLLLLLLFLTSNDMSIRLMGVWWERLHWLTYVIVWLIFLHVALLQVSIWSVIIGFFAVLEVVSHLYALLFSQKRAEGILN
jgi:DMSO/TMAO reductase YedYZ heme-binding membrane subunit